MENLCRALGAGFIFLSLLNFRSNCFGQNQIQENEKIVNKDDSNVAKIRVLNQRYKEFRDIDPDMAKNYLDSAWFLVDKTNHKLSQAETLLSYGDYDCYIGKYELAEKLVVKALLIYQCENDVEGIATSYNTLGKVKLQSGDYQNALTYFLKAANLFEQIGALTGLSIAYHNIGGVHFDQDRLDKALEFWEKSLELEMEIQDTTGTIYSLNAIGSVYYTKGEFSEGLQIMHESLKLAQLIEDSSQISYLFMNIGAQHQMLAQLDSARYYYQQSLGLLKRTKNHYDLAIQYANLGWLECDMNDGQTAATYFDSSLVVARELNSPLILENAYAGLADANKLSGNYEAAYNWLDKCHKIKDSLSGVEVKLQLNEIQEKYEAGQKDKKIIELEKKEAKAVAIADKRKALFMVVVTATVAVILTMFFYTGRRRAREKQQRAELEQKALRTQMNPHFIFNSLGAIQQMYMSGEMDLANNYMGDFGSLMRKILDNSGKDRINLKEELEMLHLYLELEKGRNNEMIEYEMEIDERIDQLSTQIPPMVIQPFVENAIWHGILPKKKMGKILVKVKLSESTCFLICQIEDNGVGIADRKVRKGHEPKGMKITEQRLGTGVVTEDLTPGTRVTINIPL